MSVGYITTDIFGGDEMQLPTCDHIPDFPTKGRYRVYSKDYTPSDWSDVPQYPGQIASRFPPEWSPLKCFIAASHIERCESRHDH